MNKTKKKQLNRISPAKNVAQVQSKEYFTIASLVHFRKYVHRYLPILLILSFINDSKLEINDEVIIINCSCMTHI